jgi:septal ring factor EnvC (AmiA/AmiB activator)
MKMADVTAELMFDEVLRSVQARLAQVDGKIDELKQEMQASRTSQNGIRHEITSEFQEISGVHATLVRHEGRLDRIERRLELSDTPIQ